MSQPYTPPDANYLPYERPDDKVKTLNVPPVEESIKVALKKYQDAARGAFSLPFFGGVHL